MDAALILDFWFGELDAEGLADAPHTQRWWSKDAAFDGEIRQRFLGTWQALVGSRAEPRASTTRGEGPPLETAQEKLAAVIVLDQFSRNMFRNDARAFSADAQALALARNAIARDEDRLLRGQHRVFLYMPFMHSEQLADQDLCIALFSRFRDETQGALQKTLEMNVGFAQRHRDIIARFGRFPHRNQVLQRVSTTEELLFLQQPGSSF